VSNDPEPPGQPRLCSLFQRFAFTVCGNDDPGRKLQSGSADRLGTVRSDLRLFPPSLQRGARLVRTVRLIVNRLFQERRRSDRTVQRREARCLTTPCLFAKSVLQRIFTCVCLRSETVGKSRPKPHTLPWRPAPDTPYSERIPGPSVVGRRCVRPCPDRVNVASAVQGRLLAPGTLTPLRPYALTPLRPYALMPLCPYALMPLCPYALMPLCPYALMRIPDSVMVQ